MCLLIWFDHKLMSARRKSIYFVNVGPQILCKWRLDVSDRAISRRLFIPGLWMNIITIRSNQLVLVGTNWIILCLFLGVIITNKPCIVTKVHGKIITQWTSKKKTIKSSTFQNFLLPNTSNLLSAPIWICVSTSRSWFMLDTAL